MKFERRHLCIYYIAYVYVTAAVADMKPFTTNRAMRCEPEAYAVLTEKTKNRWGRHQQDHKAQVPRKRERSQASAQLSGMCTTKCTKIIWDSGNSRRFPLPRGAGKYIAKKMLRLKHQFEMMGTLTCDIFDIRVACVGFVFTDLYYLCGKLNDKFDF